MPLSVAQLDPVPIFLCFTLKLWLHEIFPAAHSEGQ